MSLEAAHWRLSTQAALCAGFKNRGMLREGTPADLVIYDLEKLAVKPMEIAHDFPGGEWRRVKRAEGYRKILVNGESHWTTANRPARCRGICCATAPSRLASANVLAEVN
jgi:N-acyl-D-aspartate/D-glutamate deacylase